ncbi:hypothetical protein HOK021_50550 [Streptomyces hygroscopicus]|nr:hypothetical protein HOK021_50550 [Streptomyces hygroscopicus]
MARPIPVPAPVTITTLRSVPGASGPVCVVRSMPGVSNPDTRGKVKPPAPRTVLTGNPFDRP